jgi:hypothetical protein
MDFSQLRKKLAYDPIRVIEFKTILDSRVVEFDLSSVTDTKTVVNNIYDVQKELPISLAHYATTNVKAWHSDYYTHLLTDKFDSLIDTIKTACLKLYDDNQTAYIKFDLQVVELWTIIYKENDHTRLHAHATGLCDRHLSVVYFAHADDNATPLIFYKERGSEEKIEIVPKSGHLICFPAYMLHSVPTIRTGETRICLSANLNLIRTELDVEKILNRNPNLKEKHEAS